MTKIQNSSRRSAQNTDGNAWAILPVFAADAAKGKEAADHQAADSGHPKAPLEDRSLNAQIDLSSKSENKDHGGTPEAAGNQEPFDLAQDNGLPAQNLPPSGDDAGAAAGPSIPAPSAGLASPIAPAHHPLPGSLPGGPNSPEDGKTEVVPDGLIPIPESGVKPSEAFREKADWGILQAAEHITRPGLFWESDGKGNTVVTYSFPTSLPGVSKSWLEKFFPDGELDGLELFSEFSANQKTAAEQIFALWSDVANITFIPAEDGESGDIRLFNSEYHQPFPGNGKAQLPDNERGANVYINNKLENYEDLLDPGEAGYGTLMHEIGHAIGLDHSGNYDGRDSDGNLPNYYQHAEFAQDTTQYSIMSYFGPYYSGAWHSAGASTPLLFDIAAIQLAYGANYSTRTGDTVYGYGSTAGHDEAGLTFDVYDFASDDSPTFTIWDGGGEDTIDASGSNDRHYIDLHTGAFSDIGGAVANISIAAGTQIENAVGGGGNDVLIGNVHNNHLRGGAGNDMLFGSDGARDSYVSPDIDRDVLSGEDGDDIISGRWGDDVILGGNGFDRLDGDEGADYIWGGNDDDMINGGKGADVLNGDAGDDTIYGHLSGPEDPDDPHRFYADTDWIFGGEGDDTIYGGFGDDLIYGDSSFHTVLGQHPEYPTESTDEGVDTIFGEDGDDTIFGERLDDMLDGGRGNDTIHGGSGNDMIFGGSGDDELYGDSGDDWMIGGVGLDAYDGGIGVDTVEFSYSDRDWYVDLTLGYANSSEFVPVPGQRGERMWFIENVMMGGGVDYVVGSDVANEIWGGAGGDFLFGRMGNDLLFGGAGDDEMEGGLNDDVLSPGSGDDFVNGGDGYDTVTYDWDWAGVVINLGASTNQATGARIGTDQIYNVEHAIGGEGDDEITGTIGRNTLHGGDGEDILDGGAASDRLFGDAGDDTLRPGTGHDFVDGGEGNDTVEYTDTGMGWVVNLSLADGQARSTNGVFTQTIENVENVKTGAFNDTLVGTGDSNILEGGGGNDKLYGMLGDDFLFGGEGNDELQGNRGTDFMWGDEGADTFVFAIEEELDHAFGGEGFDTADFTTGTAVKVDLAAEKINAWLRDGSNDWLQTAELIGIERIIGSAFIDDIRGSSANETLLGGGSNDTLEGRGGVNLIDGGVGMDTAVYAGNQADYEIVMMRNGATGVSSINGELVEDTLLNVEVLSFADGDLIL